MRLAERHPALLAERSNGRYLNVQPVDPPKTLQVKLRGKPSADNPDPFHVGAERLLAEFVEKT